MTEPPSTIHPTYRHLDRPVRLAGLTLAHWAQLLLAGAVAYGVAQLLPFSATWNLSIATTLAGTPLAVSIAAASGTTPDPVAYARALWAWRRASALFTPPSVGDDEWSGDPSGRSGTSFLANWKEAARYVRTVVGRKL